MNEQAPKPRDVKIIVNMAAAGEGKTAKFIVDACKQKDKKFIYVTGTKDLINEVRKRIRDHTKENILRIYENSPEIGDSLPSVAINNKKLTDSNRIILTTFESLRRASHRLFENRVLVIDEMPNFFQFNKLSKADKEILEKLELISTKKNEEKDEEKDEENDIETLTIKRTALKRVKEGESSIYSDSIRPIIDWLEVNSEDNYYSNGWMCKSSISPKVFRNATKTYILSATPWMGFFSLYLILHKIKHIVTNEPSQHESKAIKVKGEYSPWQQAQYITPISERITNNSLSLKIRFLLSKKQDQPKNGVLSKHFLESNGFKNSKTLGTAIKNKVLCWHKKNDVLLCLNKDSTIRGHIQTKAGLIEIDPLTPPLIGLNKYSEKTVLIYLSALQLIPDQTRMLANICGTERIRSKEASRDNHLGHLYQTAMRMALRKQPTKARPDITAKPLIKGGLKAKIEAQAKAKDEAKDEDEAKAEAKAKATEVFIYVATKTEADQLAEMLVGSILSGELNLVSEAKAKSKSKITSQKKS